MCASWFLLLFVFNGGGEEKMIKLDREMGKIWEELRKEKNDQNTSYEFFKIKAIE